MTRLSADYGADIVGASRSALLDLSLTLRSYDNALVLVGGWVPYFLIEEAQRGRSGFTHVGSIDIDFVVDADVVGEDEYATIVQLLTERGWVQAPNSRFSFLRSTRAPGNRRDDEVAVDFLTTEPQSVGRAHRHRRIQRDLNARTLRGAPLAIRHRRRLRLGGTLLGGGEASAEIYMADLVACVALKGLALGSRYREKDAYDLYALLRYGEGGPRGIGERVRDELSDPLVGEGCQAIRELFARVSSAGPTWVGAFMAPGDAEARAAQAEQAFLVVGNFLDELD